MSDATSPTALPPEGFAPHFRKSPVTDAWEPLFSRRVDGSVQIGLRLAAAGGLVTVSLSLDYVGAARLGQWLQIEPRVIKTGKSMAFADALVTADGSTIARASATFRVLA